VKIDWNRLWAWVKERGGHYYRLTRLDRPIGAFLLLWPMLWGLWIAGDGHPRVSVVVVFVLGVFVMRSAGCVINDFADRRFDPHVRRTRARPLAAGHVGAGEALALFVVLCLIAFGLVLTMNRLTVWLSLGGVLLAAIYPFLKRYTYLPQVGLGLAFGWAVPMAYAAQTATLPKTAWLVYALAVIWAVIYDTMYAMVDREDDIRIGVKSTAILFGDADRFIIGLLQLIMLFGLFLLGSQVGMGIAYYVGVGGAVLLGLYQQYLIRNREPGDCFRAFLNNNWLGGLIFAGIVIDYLLRR